MVVASTAAVVAVEVILVILVVVTLARTPGRYNRKKRIVHVLAVTGRRLLGILSLPSTSNPRKKAFGPMALGNSGPSD